MPKDILRCQNTIFWLEAVSIIDEGTVDSRYWTKVENGVWKIYIATDIIYAFRKSLPIFEKQYVAFHYLISSRHTINLVLSSDAREWCWEAMLPTYA